MFGREIMIRMGRRAGTALCVLLAACPRAFALNPALDVSQLAHTAWRIRDGFAKGTITSIAQTPDGYLWLGTEFGVLNFDGVTFAPWKPPPGQFLPSNSISSLLAGRGTLWLGTSQGLASWNNWKLTEYAELAGQTIRAPILESRDGTVWAGGLAFPPPGKLCAIQKGSVRCYGEDGVLGNGVRGLYEDRGRNLWVGVQDGLWQWKPGPPKFYPESGSGNGIEGLAETVDGSLLFGPRTGVKRLVGGKIEAYSLPGIGSSSRPHCCSARAMAISGSELQTEASCMSTRTGPTYFARRMASPGDLITALFIDREGTFG